MQHNAVIFLKVNGQQRNVAQSLEIMSYGPMTYKMAIVVKHHE